MFVKVTRKLHLFKCLYQMTHISALGMDGRGGGGGLSVREEDIVVIHIKLVKTHVGGSHYWGMN